MQQISSISVKSRNSIQLEKNVNSMLNICHEMTNLTYLCGMQQTIRYSRSQIMWVLIFLYHYVISYELRYSPLFVRHRYLIMHEEHILENFYVT